MKISVKELGPIQSAEIDLSNKMTVFCGANGTGKTYLSFLLYFVTNLNTKSFGISLGKEFINELITTNQTTIDLDIEEIWQYRNKEIINIRKNLWNFFAMAESKQEEYFGKTSIEILETKEEFENRLVELNDDWFFWGGDIDIVKQAGSKKIVITLKESVIKNTDLTEVLELSFLSRLYCLLAFYPIISSTIFPVERNSIFTFSRELSLNKGTAVSWENNRYPLPIKDALAVANDLEQIQKWKSEYFEFAEEIERELLKGNIVVSKEGSVEFKSEKAKTRSLSFHQSSSLVKMLASLIIYLKHIANRGDLIIIDEPELNLHPSNQILLTRIFARLMGKGLRLLISTHSDYIIREINNLLMIGQGNEAVMEIAKTAGYRDDELIKPDSLGVYMFDYKNKTSKKVEVKPIKIGKGGFNVSSIDNTIDAQNQISEDLFYTLQYGKAEK